MICSCKGGNLDRFIQPHILLLLADREMYGLEIINELGKKAMFLDRSPDPTGVYRYLRRMEAEGQLKSRMKKPGTKDKPVRFYSITDYGRQCLASWAVALGQYSVDIIGLVTEIEDSIDKK